MACSLVCGCVCGCVQIKILKRMPDSKGQPSTPQGATTSTVQRKSLAEREAEYASAR